MTVRIDRSPILPNVPLEDEAKDPEKVEVWRKGQLSVLADLHRKVRLDLEESKDTLTTIEAPAAGTITPDKLITITCNGVDYQIGVKVKP